MLSKNKIKYIKSLDTKKARNEAGVFLAEGHKLVGDLWEAFDCDLLVATKEWLEHHPEKRAGERIEVSQEELARVSLQKTPQQVLAVFRQRPNERAQTEIASQLCLALDGIQDPGNLGTIIRVADWYGIRHIFCSNDTVDVYHPKVVQATMGALARVQVHETDLPELFRSLPNGYPVYGTFLDGEDMYEQALTDKGIIVMGNEGKGISKVLESMVTHRLFIPNYPKDSHTSESLNVALATGIICAEFRRRIR